MKWNSLEEKKTLLHLVKSLLIAENGQELKITPVKQQAWISYPPPENFKLYWCDEVTEFSQKSPTKTQERMLIPALREIAGIIEPRYSIPDEKWEYVSPEDMKINVTMAEGYLRKDPELRKLFENYEQKNREAARRKTVFTAGLMKKLAKDVVKPVSPKKARGLQTFVKDNLPSLICNHMLCGSPADLYREGKEIWFGDNLVGKGDQVFSKIDKFVKRETKNVSNLNSIKRIKKIELDAFEAKMKLQPEIRKLIIRVKSESASVNNAA